MYVNYKYEIKKVGRSRLEWPPTGRWSGVAKSLSIYHNSMISAGLLDWLYGRSVSIGSRVRNATHCAPTVHWIHKRSNISCFHLQHQMEMRDRQADTICVFEISSAKLIIKDLTKKKTTKWSLTHCFFSGRFVVHKDLQRKWQQMF